MKVSNRVTVLYCILGLICIAVIVTFLILINKKTNSFDNYKTKYVEVGTSIYTDDKQTSEMNSVVKYVEQLGLVGKLSYITDLSDDFYFWVNAEGYNSCYILTHNGGCTIIVVTENGPEIFE